VEKRTNISHKEEGGLTHGAGTSRASARGLVNRGEPQKPPGPEKHPSIVYRAQKGLIGKRRNGIVWGKLSKRRNKREKASGGQGMEGGSTESRGRASQRRRDKGGSEKATHGKGKKKQTRKTVSIFKCNMAPSGNVKQGVRAQRKKI